MIKNLFAISLIISVLFFSCSKSNNSSNGPQNTVKIELIGGNNQTDTIGKTLASSIIVRVKQNGTPTSGYTVQLVSSGCGQTDTTTTLSQPDGTVYYNWSLAGDVGSQTLKAYVLNPKNQKVDSVTVTATGVSPGSGWHTSACSLQVGSSATALCKLSTGRLFTCFAGAQTYLRYSDDNGMSWTAVKSLGNTHTVTNVFSSLTDELFVFTKGNDGFFYSNDAGKTWSNLGVAPFNTEIFSSAISTKSGKLIVTSPADPFLSISIDKGKTWTTVPSTAFTPQVSSAGHPAEDADGNLYVVGATRNVYKSVDGGTTWNIITETGYNSPGDVLSFYIDNNNLFYKSTIQFQPGIYISTDKGNTYNMLIHATPVQEYDTMSLQNDGVFYYEDTASGFYSFDGTNSKLIYAYGGSFAQPYLLAKNNNIIFANEGHGGIRYYIK